ncbi:MAG: RNA 2',3'-cyclic phosphodiesterase [bacterium]|nr:RNA 2',3'-cyclic phosphodiesterase [bacterium]
MQKKRIFIAINLAPGVRDELGKHIADLVAELPESVRFVPPEFLHFTLTFLGDQTDETIGDIVSVMRDLVPQFTPPEIAITGVTYGPPGKAPRMIWAMTDEASSEAIGEIKTAIEDALSDRGVRFEREARKYLGHLTLARFERAENLPNIEMPISIRFIPESVDLMESGLKRSGAEYGLLTEIEFGE